MYKEPPDTSGLPELKPPDFPIPVPLTVPANRYLCQITGVCIKRVSQWKVDGVETFYFELPMKIKDAAGNTFKFGFNFNEKNPIYAEIMMLVGGKKSEIGLITVPPTASIIGKLFMAQVTERSAKNDKARIVNEILRVWPCPPRKPETEPETGPETQPEPEPKPETEPESKPETAPEMQPEPAEEEEEEIIPF